MQYSPLVKFVAGRVGAGLPSTVENADLVSYGLFGLIDAIEKFDHERGLKFETYALSRIRGSIIDELRGLDWVPRSVRSRSREVERAYIELENELHRAPATRRSPTGWGSASASCMICSPPSRSPTWPRSTSSCTRARAASPWATRWWTPARGAGGRFRERVAQGGHRRRAAPDPRTRADHHRAVLLRGLHPGRDRAGARGHREQGEPVAQQGDAAVAREAGRGIARLSRRRVSLGASPWRLSEATSGWAGRA